VSDSIRQRLSRYANSQRKKRKQLNALTGYSEGAKDLADIAVFAITALEDCTCEVSKTALLLIKNKLND
jgi:hypothetical protein